MKRLSLGGNHAKSRGIINEGIESFHIIQELNGNNSIIADNKTINPVCLNCPDIPCKDFKASEVATTILENMPANPSQSVCPVDAISQDKNSGFPVINAEICFGCGLCFNRCPYGAISLDFGHTAEVLRGENEITSFKEVDTITELHKNVEFRIYQKETLNNKVVENSLSNFYKNLSILRSSKAGFENLFLRNILLCLGLKAKIKNTGNNDIRFDLLGEQDDNVVVASIDLAGGDTLNIPRYLLDAIAVLHSRHGIDKRRIAPIIVVGGFPNKRSDFYEMIGDIQDVTGFEIKIFSLHFLLLMVLFNKALSIDNIKGMFNLNKNKKTITDEAQVLIPGLIEIDSFFGNGYYGAIK